MKLTKFEYHQRSGFGIGGAWKNTPVWVAEVESKGHLFGFSRFDNETNWCCDYHFGANMYPYFCHGEGSRSCSKQIATGELAAMLDKAKSEWNGSMLSVHGVA